MNKSKIVVVTGATGFIGEKVVKALLLKDYKVRILTRNPEAHKARLNDLPVELFAWDPINEPAPQQALEGSIGVIHLAGEPVAGTRWSAERKRRILESRSIGTKNLVQTINSLKQKPAAFISSSAIGIYGDQGAQALTENSPHATTFLGQVCSIWEQEATLCSHAVRTVILRIGIVLGQESGALKEMLPIFRLGLGGPLGSGKQFMSWIHVDDLVQLFVTALEQNKFQGIYNATAPTPVTNKEFTKTLSQVLGMPALFPAPALALKIALGEMSTIVLSSQNIIPHNLKQTSFVFQYPNLRSALENLLAPKNLKGAHTLTVTQFIPASEQKVFDFFSEAKNLETITPPWLNFRITNCSTPKISAGTLFEYKLKVRGLPVKWKTLISTWQPNQSFTDTMLKGPYKFWDHTHEFKIVQDGILMTDKVHYKVPFGILGEFVALIWVHSDVKTIFKYRSDTIKSLFRS